MERQNSSRSCSKSSGQKTAERIATLTASTTAATRALATDTCGQTTPVMAELAEQRGSDLREEKTKKKKL
ncbi:hypothetical protein RHMOL_Rhmol05G0196500 [Rhododendron molle]|uniref:Uncharacterized protein n=1 Tax=Rhododendron molle TaxID=49168 RepID=A0ACC0NR37_RHOML|nr:hypothetical protein RHMOL_Rhmol05G0196500 [Rhododendron molle]